MTPTARARLHGLAQELRETETTVARKGDVEITVCVLDPIVLKRWADELEAALAAEEGDRQDALAGYTTFIKSGA
jgi:hypothetical protein